MNAAERAIQKIAEQESVTAEYVRKQMQLAILSGLCSSDPNARGFWDKVPNKNGVPSPEELILYISEKIKRDTNL